MIFEKSEKEILLESNNVAQSESQIIEDDDIAIFDAPQQNTSKSEESNNCSKVEKESKLEDQNTKKSVESSNIEQNASQMIEDESSPMMNLSECVGDVSCIFLSYYLYKSEATYKIHCSYPL